MYVVGTLEHLGQVLLMSGEIRKMSILFGWKKKAPYRNNGFNTKKILFYVEKIQIGHKVSLTVIESFDLVKKK